MGAFSASLFALFILLAPGFLFFFGLYTFGRLTKEDHQRGPVYDAAILVIASCFFHFVVGIFYFGIVEYKYGDDILTPLDFFESRSPPSAAPPVQLVPRDTKIIVYVLYLALCSTVAILSGKIVIDGVEKRNWPIKFIHGPYFDMFAGEYEPIVFISVLTNISYQNRFVLYYGFLEDISFLSYNKINYICLYEAKRSLLKLKDDSAEVTAEKYHVAIDDLDIDQSVGSILTITGDRITNFAFRTVGHA